MRVTSALLVLLFAVGLMACSDGSSSTVKSVKTADGTEIILTQD